MLKTFGYLGLRQLSILNLHTLLLSNLTARFIFNSFDIIGVRSRPFSMAKPSNNPMVIKAWHQHDDRDCEDYIQNQTYSFFCALQIASIEVDGYYNHRNAVMQKIRHLINERHPGRRWANRLRDFNNIPETTHDTILEMLDDAEEAILQAVSSED
jgi:hypothetical protein